MFTEADSSEQTRLLLQGQGQGQGYVFQQGFSRLSFNFLRSFKGSLFQTDFTFHPSALIFQNKSTRIILACSAGHLQGH